MSPSLGSLKRPMLTMKHITSVRQLSFFVEHLGLYVYQSSFTLCKPDLPFIESLLQNDLLKEEDLNKNNGVTSVVANTTFIGGTEFSF